MIRSPLVVQKLAARRVIPPHFPDLTARLQALEKTAEAVQVEHVLHSFRESCLSLATCQQRFFVSGVRPIQNYRSRLCVQRGAHCLENAGVPPDVAVLALRMSFRANFLSGRKPLNPRQEATAFTHSPTVTQRSTRDSFSRVRSLRCTTGPGCKSVPLLWDATPTRRRALVPPPHHSRVQVSA